MLLNYNVRRDDRVRNDNRSNGGYHKSNRQSGEDGWLATSKSRSSTFFDASKFKNNKSSLDDNNLGSASQFKWNTASAAAPPLANTFAALDSARSGGSVDNSARNNRNARDNYHSKGSMERYQYSDRNNSRSGSQHRSRENSLARNYTQRNIPPFNRSSQSMNALPTPQPSIAVAKPIEVDPSPVEPPSNQISRMQKLARELLDNHHIGEVSIANCHVDVDKFPVEQRWALIRELFNTAVETQGLKTADRSFAGKSLNQWLKMKLITHCDILTGLKSFLEPVEDISLDIPHIWLYIAEMITPLIENGNIKLVHLKTVCPDHAHRILEDLLPYMESTLGQKYVKSLVKLYELKNLVPKTELIS
ncbi:Eukaryotic translation initiation factor 4 gamma 3, partial [Pseudolycoriella hygida]